jgi:hypothetical protein
MVSSSAHLFPKVTRLAMPSSIFMSKFQTRPLVREDSPYKKGKYLEIVSVEREINWLRVPDGGLIPGQTGRLTVGRKINLNLNLNGVS